MIETDSRQSTDSASDAPVIGLIRAEPRSSHGNSIASSLMSPTRNPEAILSSKKESIGKDHHVPKTEYAWRHAPVFDIGTGHIQPVYIGAGIGDLSAETYYSDEVDELGADFGTTGMTAKGEEDLLFRESGYGFGGMLPGLGDRTSVERSSGADFGSVVGHDPAPVRKARVASDVDGEVTKPLKRMRERMRSGALGRRMARIGWSRERGI
jgi:hypothetical protein